MTKFIMAMIRAPRSILNFILVVYFLFLAVFDIAAGDACAKIDGCGCESSDGVIDLKPLASSSDAPRFRFTDTAEGYDYFWSPCVNSPEPCGTFTTDVASCQKKGGTSYLIGLLSTATFSGEAEKDLKLTYTNRDVTIGQNRVTHISLICDKSIEANFKFINENPTVNYNFELRSKYACLQRGGLSTGSILLIVFFTLLTVYLVAGILFLRFYRGATGKEMIPNLEFWKEIPSLIRDGFCFVRRGCKGDPTFSQI